MTKFERVIVVTGAGVIVLAFLLGRRGRSLLSVLGPSADTAPGIPPRTVTTQPINNTYSTCNCPDAKTTQKQPGDFSQGSYVRFGAVAVPPSVSG